jgi:hypothetical protein
MKAVGVLALGRRKLNRKLARTARLVPVLTPEEEILDTTCLVDLAAGSIVIGHHADGSADENSFLVIGVLAKLPDRKRRGAIANKETGHGEDWGKAD